MKQVLDGMRARREAAFALIARLGEDQTGAMPTGGLFSLLIVALIGITAVIPTIFTAIVGTDTTSWDAGSVALWGIIGIVVVYVFITKIMGKGNVGG